MCAGRSISLNNGCSSEKSVVWTASVEACIWIFGYCWFGLIGGCFESSGWLLFINGNGPVIAALNVAGCWTTCPFGNGYICFWCTNM